MAGVSAAVGRNPVGRVLLSTARIFGGYRISLSVEDVVLANDLVLDHVVAQPYGPARPWAEPGKRLIGLECGVFILTPGGGGPPFFSFLASACSLGIAFMSPTQRPSTAAGCAPGGTVFFSVIDGFRVCANRNAVPLRFFTIFAKGGKPDHRCCMGLCSPVWDKRFCRPLAWAGSDARAPLGYEHFAGARGVGAPGPAP